MFGYHSMDDLSFGGLAMQKQNMMRLRGWVTLIIGLALAIGVSALAIHLAPSLLHSGMADGSTMFNGTQNQGRLVLLLFGVIIAFAIIAFLNGFYMVRTGTRHRLLFGLMIAMVVILLLTILVTLGMFKPH
jgi:hypothetical protein